MSIVATPIAPPEPLIERAGRLAQLHEWVVTVDHKRLGVMYVVAGLAFFLVAGLEASVIRWQLAAAGNTVVSPQVFKRSDPRCLGRHVSPRRAHDGRRDR